MAASTVQLPNECACGTATWGQEGFLVEGMVDEGRSEYGLVGGNCVDFYETLDRISKPPQATAGEAGNGCITLYIKLCTHTGSSRRIRWQIQSSKENEEAFFSHCVFFGRCIDNGIFRCGGASPMSDFLFLFVGK
jgi:hypothetical protein